MKKVNMERLGMVVLIGILVLGAVGIASAQQTLPKGGDSFENAVEIQPGSYVRDHEMPEGSREYYKISVKPEQILKIEFTHPNPKPYLKNMPFGAAPLGMAVAISNEDGELLATDYPSSSEFKSTLSWAPNSESGDTIYIALGGTLVANAKDGKYDIILEDHSDAGNQTEEGTTDNAIEPTEPPVEPTEMPSTPEPTKPTQTPVTTPTESTPAFEAIFAIAGLLVIAYILRREK